MNALIIALLAEHGLISDRGLGCLLWLHLVGLALAFAALVGAWLAGALPPDTTP